MNFDELGKYALLLASVVSGWLAVITDRDGNVRKPALATTVLAIALLASYLVYRDYQAAQTILVAHYPGYHKGVKPKDPSKIVYVTAPAYEDLQNGVRNNRKADVLILSSGIYARLLKNAATSGIEDLECFVADQQKKGPSVDWYLPALLINSHCPNFDSIRKMRAEEALAAVASDLRAAEIRSPGSARRRVLFVDPFSASGFYVPVKELGLIQTIHGEPLIRCASSHSAAIRKARDSRECVITPTNFDELEISDVVDSTGKVRENLPVAVIPLRFQIPRSPHCVRKRFFGGEKSFFQSNFKADELSVPEPERYRQLYDDYIGPVDAAAGRVQCDSADDAPRAGPPFSAVYIDLDGTLLKPLSAGKNVAELEPLKEGQFGVHRQDMAALRRFTACGGQIGFATGRTLSQIPSQLLDLKPQLPFVLANGAIIQDASGAVIASTPLPLKASEELVALSTRLRGVAATVIQSARDNVLIRMNRSSNIDAFLSGGQLNVTECTDLAHCNLLTHGVGDISKVMFVARTGDAVGLSRTIAQRVGDRFSIATGGGTAGWMSIEINAMGADKNSGIKRALSCAGVDMKDLVVFGDGRNDVPMLSGVAVSFASNYAPAEARDAAMAIANPNGGNERTSAQVGRVIERLLLQACQ